MNVIDGVKVKDLKVYTDERGHVMPLLRCDDPDFQKFGQMTASFSHFGTIRAWHWHRLHTDYMACIYGMMKVVLYDDRPESKTFRELMELFIGCNSNKLIIIPPSVIHGFKCISPKGAILIYNTTEPYNERLPDELRSPLNSGLVPYKWEKVNK